MVYKIVQRLGSSDSSNSLHISRQLVGGERRTLLHSRADSEQSLCTLPRCRWEEAVRTTLQTNTEFVETGELRDGEPLWRLVPPEGAAAAQVLPES